jgi:hypothetical protein
VQLPSPNILTPKLEDEFDRDATRLSDGDIALCLHYRARLIGEWKIRQRGPAEVLVQACHDHSIRIATRHFREQMAHGRDRRFVGGTSGLAAALMLAACGGGSSKNETKEPEDKSGLMGKVEDTTAKAVKGGVWPSSFMADTPHFDGMVGGSGPWFENHFAYGYLLKAPVFNKLKGEQIDTSVVGDVAESWEQSPDVLQITFKIRANAGLDPRPPTNGRMMDAEDVVFAWNRFRAEAPDLVVSDLRMPRGNVVSA